VGGAEDQGEDIEDSRRLGDPAVVADRPRSGAVLSSGAWVNHDDHDPVRDAAFRPGLWWMFLGPWTRTVECGSPSQLHPEEVRGMTASSVRVLSPRRSPADR